MFHENWYKDSQCRDLEFLSQEVKSLGGAVIEIGCWEGKSTSHLANASYPNTVTAVDTWRGNVAESACTGVRHPTEIICEKRDVFARFKANMDALTRGNYEIVRQDCLKWLKTFRKPVKLAHIDASHEYESVFETIQALKPLVVPGGILCGDDFKSAHAGRKDLNGGVERAVRESFGDKFVQRGNLWIWRNK
jgi:predicted O-methyltransferase YrrM